MSRLQFFDDRYKSQLFEGLLDRYAYLLPCPQEDRGWIVVRGGAPGGPPGHHFVKRGGWTRAAGEALVFPRGRDARYIALADPKMYAIPTNVFRCMKCWEEVPWDFGCYLDGDGIENDWCDSCWCKFQDDEAA